MTLFYTGSLAVAVQTMRLVSHGFSLLVDARYRVALGLVMLAAMTCKFVIALVLIAWAGSVVPDTLTGRVVKIADGDILTLLDATNTQQN